MTDDLEKQAREVLAAQFSDEINQADIRAHILNGLDDPAIPIGEAIDAMLAFRTAQPGEVTAQVYESAVKGRQDFRAAYRETLDRLKRAFEPSEEEASAIRQMGTEKELSDAAVIRQALRLYQMVDVRLKAGETMMFSGDAQRARDFAGALATPPQGKPDRQAVARRNPTREEIEEALIYAEETGTDYADAILAALPSEEGWREERGGLAKALRKLETAATLVTEWLDRINDRDGTALGGPQWFELGRAIATARTALESHMPDKGDGCWRPCTGCFEAGEYGGLEHLYPLSTVFGCRVGGGCGECGGLGVVWDSTDYEDMARWSMEQDAILDSQTRHLKNLAGGFCDALHKLKSRSIGGNPKGNAFAYAEVPDWLLRQWLERVGIIESSLTQGIAARSDETLKAAQPEGQEPGAGTACAITIPSPTPSQGTDQ